MEVTTLRDLVFARPEGFRPLSLDLHVPQGEQTGLCLYLHGGGWRRGGRADPPGETRSWSPSFFETVAATGLAVASVDYRLSAEATFPAQADDVAAAAAWLAAEGGRLGVTTGRTVGWGVSAGGHLIALHALARGLDAVALWYAPTDLDRLSADVEVAGGEADRSAGSREGMLLGAALDAVPDAVRAASPVHAVGPEAPPFLLLHGTADVAVPPAQSHRFADAVRAAGGSATVELVDGSPHMFTGLDQPRTRAVVDRTVAFLSGPS